MPDAGTCSRSSTGCKAGYYCPTVEDNEVSCIACSDDIKLGQGCYCVSNTVNTHCRECTNNTCSKCIPGSFLDGDGCTICSKGCGKCKSSDKCEACAEGYTMEKNICVRVCNSLQDCEQERMTFCNLSANRCEPCESNCVFCSSKTVCNFCNPNLHTTTIDGKCTTSCTTLQNGEYCKDGVATSCAEGLDSACRCGAVRSCASCNDKKTACETCLPNTVKAKDGTCSECAEGYEILAGMCWAKQGGVQQNKIGGGAIAGIIIGVLVVAGAVGGGLAYYFIKKARK